MYPASMRPQQQAKKGKRKHARSCTLSPRATTSNVVARKVLAPLSSQRNERTVQHTPKKATPTKHHTQAVRRTPSPMQHSITTRESVSGPRPDNSTGCSPSPSAEPSARASANATPRRNTRSSLRHAPHQSPDFQSNNSHYAAKVKATGRQMPGSAHKLRVISNNACTPEPAFKRASGAQSKSRCKSRKPPTPGNSNSHANLELDCDKTFRASSRASPVSSVSKLIAAEMTPVAAAKTRRSTGSESNDMQYTHTPPTVALAASARKAARAARGSKSAKTKKAKKVCTKRKEMAPVAHARSKASPTKLRLLSRTELYRYVGLLSSQVKALGRDNHQLRAHVDCLGRTMEETNSATAEAELGRMHEEAAAVVSRYNRLQQQAKELHQRHEILKELRQNDKQSAKRAAEQLHEVQKQLAHREQEIAQHQNERRSPQADSHLVVELQAQLLAARNENMALAAQSSALAATVEHGTLCSAQRQREADSRAAQAAAMWQKRAEEHAAAAEAALALLNDSKIELATRQQRIEELEQKASPKSKQEADQEQEAELEADGQQETLECYAPEQQAHRIQALEKDLLVSIATHCSPLDVDGAARTCSRLHMRTASESKAEECIETALAQQRKLFEKQLSQERAQATENLAQMVPAEECEFSNVAKSTRETFEAANNALLKQSSQNHESALAAEKLKCAETLAALNKMCSERDHALKNLTNVTGELKAAEQRLQQSEAEAMQRTEEINAQLQAAQGARLKAEEHANLERDSCAAEVAVMQVEIEQLERKLHDTLHEGKRARAELVSRHEAQLQQSEMTANAQADELRAEIATLMDVTVEERERAANEIQALRLKNAKIEQRMNSNYSSEFDSQRHLQQCTKAWEEKILKQEADHAATVAQMQTDFVNRSHAAIEIQEGLKAQHKTELNQAVQRHAKDLQNLEEEHRSSMDAQRIAAEKILCDALNAERARLHDQHSTELRTVMLQKEEEQQAALKQQAQELEAAQQSKKEQLQIALQDAFNTEQRRQQQCHIKELESVREQVDQKWQAKYKAAVEDMAAKLNDKAQAVLAENTKNMERERKAAASAAAQSQRVAIAQAISEQTSKMQEATQRDKEAHEAALQHLRAQHTTELSRAAESYEKRAQERLQSLQQEHEEKISAAKHAALAESAAREAQYKERLMLVKQEHQAALQNEAKAHQAATAEAVRENTSKMQIALQRLLTSKHDSHAKALEELRQKHEEQQQAAADAYEAKVQERLRAQLDELQCKYANDLSGKMSDLEKQTASTLSEYKMQSQRELQKVKSEHEAAASAAAQSQRVAIAQAISEQTSKMQEATQRDKEAHEAALQHLRAQHTTELSRAAESYEKRAQERLQSLQQEHEEKISAAKHAALAESAAREAQYKERLMLVKQEHQAALQNEAKAHQAATAAAIDAKENEFSEKVRALEHAHAERMAALVAEHQSNVKVELAVKEAEVRAELRADCDKLNRKHKEDIIQLEARITTCAARASDTSDGSVAKLRHKLKDVKRKGREYVEQMTAVHKTELLEVQVKLNNLEQACMAAEEREQCTAAKLTELQSSSEQAALRARDHLADMQKQLNESKLAVEQKNNQIAELVRQTQTQALHYTKHEAALKDFERHSAHTVGGSDTCEHTTNTSERHNCISRVMEGRSCTAKRGISSPVLARPKKDVASSCIGHAQAKTLSPRDVSPRMGRHLMPELNGSIWRPMSPLESSPNHAILARPYASGRAHPDAIATPSSQSKTSRSRLLRQLSTGQEAESWAAEVLRSIDF